MLALFFWASTYTVGAMTPTLYFVAGMLCTLVWVATLALCEARSTLPVRRRMLGGVTPRQAVAMLSLSAAGLVGLVVHEGYTDKAVVPTQGDRPTIGFGSTVHEDDTPVKMGDTTTPQRALLKAQAHISKDEAAFRASLPGVELHQGEYDLYLDWMYQFGQGAWQRSPMRRDLVEGNHRQACDGLLIYRKMTSARQEGPGWVVSQRDAKGNPTRWEFDCSTPGNRVCMGVWTRAQKRHQRCMELAQ